MTNAERIAHIAALFEKAETALNNYVEEEMRAIMRACPEVTCLLKCMGALTAYDENGDSFDFFDDFNAKPPARVVALHDVLENHDVANTSRTGHPLKLKRCPTGSGEIIETRNW